VSRAQTIFCILYLTVILPSTVAKRLARHFAFARSRVLTPVPPNLVWVFFQRFPHTSHRGMSHITDKGNAGSVSTSQYLPTLLPYPSPPYPSRIFPSVWLKRLWKASAGEERPFKKKLFLRHHNKLYFIAKDSNMVSKSC
jgi:hypothetical protein